MESISISLTLELHLFVYFPFSVLFNILTLSNCSHFAHSHFVQLFPLCAGTYTQSIYKRYPLRNSRIVRYNSGIGGHSENSHFAQDNFGIVPILTMRRTYIYIYKIQSRIFGVFGRKNRKPVVECYYYTL